MDRFEPLTLTVNAVFELTTVKTVSIELKYMNLLGEGINGDR